MGGEREGADKVSGWRCAGEWNVGGRMRTKCQGGGVSRIGGEMEHGDKVSGWSCEDEWEVVGGVCWLRL